MYRGEASLYRVVTVCVEILARPEPALWRRLLRAVVRWQGGGPDDQLLLLQRNLPPCGPRDCRCSASCSRGGGAGRGLGRRWRRSGSGYGAVIDLKNPSK